MSDSLIVKTHCRTLRVVYHTQKKSYKVLFGTGGEKKIRTQNRQLLIGKYVNIQNTSIHFSHEIILGEKDKATDGAK